MSISTAQLAARIDVLESETAIRNLSSNYCHGFDKRDRALFLSIWWEDAVWDIGPPFGVFEGEARIAHALDDVLWPAWDESHHLCANQVINRQGEDIAHSVCDVDCVGRLAGEDVCQIVGATYSDTLSKRGDTWKILRREVTMHYFNPAPGVILKRPG